MKKTVDSYSFKYSGYMKNGMESLPIGNGDIGANVWLSEDGLLHLLISKTDAWSELGRLLKPAHIVLGLSPNCFENGADFELSVADGVLNVKNENVSLKIYIDSFAPALRLQISASSLVKPWLELVNYRNEEFDPKDDFSNFFMLGATYDIKESADIVALTPKGGLSQVHRNEDSCYEYSLKNQYMDFYLEKQKDPLLGHTFGVAVYAENAVCEGSKLCLDEGQNFNVSVFVGSKNTSDRKEMLDEFDAMYGKYKNVSDKGYTDHVNSWREFWEKAYIFAEGDEDAERITRAFLYQRYITRCSDRGVFPIKFNGSLFTAYTMDNNPDSYDARRWGGPYWLQNTRLSYWYLLSMGDYDSMLPLFDMYISMIPIAKARCKHYFNHDGILIPEVVSHFGLYANKSYGYLGDDGVRRGDGVVTRFGEPACRYIRYHFNGMLELSYMMLKYLRLSDDNTRRDGILSFVENTLLFYDRHFDKTDDKMVIFPVSSVETWQLCVNDLPDVAGLMAVCDLLAKESELSENLKAVHERIVKAIPALPLENTEQGTVIAPCAIKIDPITRNVENPELYAVFPYDIYGIGKPDIDTAIRTYNKRLFRHAGGWSQDPIDSALLGLTDEAVTHLIRESAMTDSRALFPVFWGPNFDETPDQCHGSVVALTLMLMLLQTDGDSYTAFPAWPEKWDVCFKLPIRNGSYVRGEQINGKKTVHKC